MLIERSVDMRYLGQVHECTVDIGTMKVDAHSFGDIRSRFDQRHQRFFTYWVSRMRGGAGQYRGDRGRVVLPLQTGARMAAADGSTELPVKEQRRGVRPRRRDRDRAGPRL